MKSLKLIAATALLGAISLQAVAENRTPAELALPIKPDYRNMDVSASEGAKFVWVQRIVAQDSQGNTQLLFDDMQGALLPLDQLSHAARLINPQQVSQKGQYDELHLQLGSRMLSVSAKGMKRTPLPQGLERNVVLQGRIEVSKFKVSNRELSLKAKPTAQLASLNR